MIEDFEYYESLLDYRTGEVVDTWEVQVRRAPDKDKEEALIEYLKNLRE